jgi:hypothetical protein
LRNTTAEDQLFELREIVGFQQPGCDAIERARIGDSIDPPSQRSRHRAKAMLHLPQDHAAHAFDHALPAAFLDPLPDAPEQALPHTLRVALTVAEGYRLSSQVRFRHP